MPTAILRVRNVRSRRKAMSLNNELDSNEED